MCQSDATQSQRRVALGQVIVYVGYPEGKVERGPEPGDEEADEDGDQPSPVTDPKYRSVQGQKKCRNKSSTEQSLGSEVTSAQPGNVDSCAECDCPEVSYYYT